MVDYAKKMEEWLQEHPEMTRCIQCQTIIKKGLTNKGLCPECYLWSKK